MSTQLNPLSYVVLAMVGRGGAGPHDLVEMLRLGGDLYWSAAASKLYAEPKRLRDLGLLNSHTEPGRTRERTVYTLTPAGEAALREWIGRPSSVPRVQHEAVVRLMAGDLAADDRTLVASLTAMRGELDRLEAHLEESVGRASALPHRERYLLLVHAFGRRLVAAHRDWLDEVEATLG